jgi:asparagine synthase (glutamine-hydrolysing)
LIEKANPTVLDGVVRHLDQPFADSSAVPTYLVSKAAGSKVKMVLSGDGGDELFGGYERYWKTQRIMSTRKILGPVLRLGNFEKRGAGDSAVGRKLKWYLHRLANDSIDDYIESAGIIPFADLRRIARFPVEGADSLHLAALLEMQEAGINEDWQALDFRTYLPEDVLVKVDRMSMANSLEVRSPLLDYRLAEYAFSLPVCWKRNRTEGKLILKDIGRDLLPGRFLSRRKQGFGVPLSEWFEQVLFARLDEYISKKDSVIEEVLDTTKLRLLREEHRRGVWNFSEFFWALLIYFMWRETLK